MSSGTFKTARERGKLAPLKFEHAVLRTTRLQAMADWYTTVLQAEVAFGNGGDHFSYPTTMNGTTALQSWRAQARSSGRRNSAGARPSCLHLRRQRRIGHYLWALEGCRITLGCRAIGYPPPATPKRKQAMRTNGK